MEPYKSPSLHWPEVEPPVQQHQHAWWAIEVGDVAVAFVCAKCGAVAAQTGAEEPDVRSVLLRPPLLSDELGYLVELPQAPEGVEALVELDTIYDTTASLYVRHGGQRRVRRRRFLREGETAAALPELFALARLFGLSKPVDLFDRVEEAIASLGVAAGSPPGGAQ